MGQSVSPSTLLARASPRPRARALAPAPAAAAAAMGEFWAPTQAALQGGDAPMVRRPRLTPELLKKPPFRFLHDVISEVRRARAGGRRRPQPFFFFFCSCRRLRSRAR